MPSTRGERIRAIHHRIVLVRHQRDQWSVDDKHEIARRHKAAFDFAVATWMVSITGMRLANTARSDQLVNFMGDIRGRFVIRAAITVVVTTAMFGLDTWGISSGAGVLASVVVPATSSMMQRTPENQVQQQRGYGGQTINGEHKVPF